MKTETSRGEASCLRSIPPPLCSHQAIQPGRTHRTPPARQGRPADKTPQRSERRFIQIDIKMKQRNSQAGILGGEYLRCLADVTLNHDDALGTRQEAVLMEHVDMLHQFVPERPRIPSADLLVRALMLRAVLLMEIGEAREIIEAIDSARTVASMENFEELRPGQQADAAVHADFNDVPRQIADLPV